MVITIAAVLAILASGGFIPGLWIFDLLSQFRLAYAVCLLLCFILLLLLRARKCAALCLAVFVLNGLPIALMLIPRNSSSGAKAEPLSILNFNTEFQHNDHYDLFDQIVRERKPDIIAVVEVNQKWIDAIDQTTKSYPFKKIVLAGAGMALFSRYPLEKVEVRYFGRTHHPRISAAVILGDRTVNVLIVHPTTPQSEVGYQERNREITMIRDEMTSAQSPKVLIGDLNCGPWAPIFAKLLQSGLHDSEQGLGPQPSWPARTGRAIENIPIPPLIPIDHVLVGDNIRVLQRLAGPAIQSDHLPVFVQLLIADPIQSDQRHLDGAQ